jgi:CheY-like chemotaxis protein
LGALLVVDDDVQMLDMLCLMLRRSHRVERASGASAALSILESGTPVDLLLTDVGMPGLNGFSLARLARQHRPGLKVLYLTGTSESEVMRDPGERHGKLLNKTISALDLLAEVERALVA